MKKESKKEKGDGGVDPGKEKEVVGREEVKDGGAVVGYRWTIRGL